MPLESAGASLVIAAHHFNPSVFSQLWLVRNNVAGEGEFRPGCLFSDQAVNVEAESFALLVVPPQLQFVPKGPPEGQGDLVRAKVGTIVRALPHTPYSAVGVNFIWHLTPDDGNIPAATRALFYVSGRRLWREFDREDARFGAYLSKDIFGCRLKLDVKPVIKHAAGTKSEVLQFAFNFHSDVPQEGNRVVEAIEGHLAKWDEAKAEATRIVQDATG